MCHLCMWKNMTDYGVVTGRGFMVLNKETFSIEWMPSLDEVCLQCNNSFWNILMVMVGHFSDWKP